VSAQLEVSKAAPRLVENQQGAPGATQSASLRFPRGRVKNPAFNVASARSRLCQIDEVEVYDYALTPDQIAAHYATGIGN